VIHDILVDDGQPFRIAGGTLHYGSRYPEDVRLQRPPTLPTDSETILDVVLKFLSFLNSPYIRAEAEMIERPVRRRTARVNEAEANKRVHVVALRRPTVPGASPSSPTEGTNWKHQWWVTGHHRAQWYARERAHKVIWIAPHLKGPADKPVLEKVYTVKR
jgi:hypothetical protein